MSYFYETREQHKLKEEKRRMRKEKLQKVGSITLKTLICVGAIMAVSTCCYAGLKLLRYLDQNEHPKEKVVKTIGDRTKLHYAAISNDPQLITDLLHKGENINAQDENGDTPLMLAARIGHTELCGVLLDAGADINMQNAEGLTALHQAIGSNRVKTAVLLVENGADLTIKNNLGATPLEFSDLHGNSEISSILINIMNQENLDEDNIKTVNKKSRVNTKSFIESNQRN